MKSKPSTALAGYAPFFSAVKGRIRAAQMKATLAANAELIHLYWDIGCVIAARQEEAGWGASVIPRLARDLANDLPEVKGFSERNLKRMVQFAAEYPGLHASGATPPAHRPAALIGPPVVAQFGVAPAADPIGPPVVAQLPKGLAHDEISLMQQLVAQLPWAHNVLLIQRVKDLRARLWYMRQTVAHGWSRNVLAGQIDNRAGERRGKAVHNFHQTLPPPQSDLAEQALKDPYLFDFLTLAEPFRERELELGLLRRVEQFLLELGQGFAFVGRQYHVVAGGEDFYLDLLFYHLRLRCFVVIDLKKGAFKPEYAGKMNFYCNVVDAHLRHPEDRPTIGLILCQDKNRVVAEYALKGVQKAIGVSEYQLTRMLPKELRSSLPTIAEMEATLAGLTGTKRPAGKGKPRMTSRTPGSKARQVRKRGRMSDALLASGGWASNIGV